MEKKLGLVLDLDNTLLQSTMIADLSTGDKYLLSDSPSVPSLRRVPSLGVLTKLRPFVRTFLEEASKLSMLYLYTLGARFYAEEMALLLDPDKVLFSGILSREDCTEPGQKRLDVVPCNESLVVILDDNDAVWQNHARNLIMVPPYEFFASSDSKKKSLSERQTDESALDGALVTALQVLRRVHEQLFDLGPSDDAACRDVRHVLSKMRREILGGCKIAFDLTAVVQPGQQPIWRMAKELGATCYVSVNETVTHVVSMHPSSPSARWAVEHRKFLVKPQWIQEAYYSWQRRPEREFSVVELDRATALSQPMIST